MRIAVLGATSRTGRCLLTEARRRGHEIVAFTRRPDDLPEASVVVHNDGRDLDAVRGALAGVDAVISLLPGGSRHDPHLSADAARTVVAAMADTDVRRLVVVSAYPVVAERPRLLMWTLRRALATPYADVAAMEAVVRASDRDWTIARLNRLVDRPASGAVVTSPDLLSRARSLSRADTATTLLDLAESPSAMRTALNVSGA